MLFIEISLFQMIREPGLVKRLISTGHYEGAGTDIPPNDQGDPG